VQETLEAFFSYQKKNGQLPIKLRSLNVISRFFHSLLEREQPVDAHLIPKYLTGHRTNSFDGQGLLVIAASKYIQACDDLDFAHKNWGKLQSAMRWLQSLTQPDTHLLTQSPFADWADSVARTGVVCYTNVVYWKALVEMATLADIIGLSRDVLFYQQLADKLKKDIQAFLWRSDLGYFATSPTMKNLSSGGNLLAVAWGLTDMAQSDSILNRIRDFGMDSPVPTQAAHPYYKRSEISIENRLGGVAHYHTEGAWLWLGAWHVIALCQSGCTERAQTLLRRLADIIVRDQQIYEVYGKDGQPISSAFYTSEAPLTWNAGMVIYAYHVLEQHLQRRGVIK
jgi:GH15 family glucan-1,4-alpha-glucosidase